MIRKFNEKQLIDNFLTQEQSQLIANVLTCDTFPWFLNRDGIAGSGNNDHPMDYYFIHTFYDNHVPTSQFYSVLEPIFKKLNFKALLRVKANLYPCTQEVRQHGMHRDQTFDVNSCLYFVNTNNGVTTFEDGTIINSVANRVILFNSFEPHCSSSCSDQKFRITINFNYF